MPATPVIPLRLRLLQTFDRAVGSVLCRVMRPRAGALSSSPGTPLAPQDVRRILVIRPGGLGDAILLRPALAALAESFPGATLDVLAERRNAAALRLGAQRWRVLCYDEKPLRIARELRAARYDLVVDTEQYHHLSVLLANWLRPHWLCGFDTLGRGRFQTHRVPHAEDDYEALSFLRLVEAVAGRRVPFDPEVPFIVPERVDVDWAANTLARSDSRPLAAVMPAAGGVYRLWPAERYAEVALWLAARGFAVVVLGGTDAIAAGRVIAAAVADALDLTGRTTLGQTAALLARSQLALSADTGVLHLAYAVGAPTVALFGPGLHRKWAPPGSAHRIVRKGLACSPCIRFGRLPPCPYDLACMRDISVAEVTAVIAAAKAVRP